MASSDRPPFGAIAASAFFVLLPAAAAAGGLALAPFQAVAGLLGAPFRNLTPRSTSAWVFLGSLLAFIFWVAISALWSPFSDHTQAYKLIGGVLCGLLLVARAGADEPSRRLIRAAGAAGLLVLAALLVIEAAADMPLNRLGQPGVDTGLLQRNPGRGVTVLVCLIWASFAALADGGAFERFAWRLLAFAAGGLTFMFDMQANALAFGVAVLAFGVGYAAPRFAILAGSIGLAGWLLAAPWALPILLDRADLIARLPDSWAVRTEIWSFVIEQINANPWFGLGLDTSRTFDQTGEVRGIAFSMVSLHPHSASLQIWLETGAVGAGLGALALIVGGWTLARALEHQRAAAAAACGCLAAIGLIANVSYGAWQEWWVATAFAAAALVSAARREPRLEP